jgi:hypothetical protein
MSPNNWLWSEKPQLVAISAKGSLVFETRRQARSTGDFLLNCR